YARRALMRIMDLAFHDVAKLDVARLEATLTGPGTVVTQMERPAFEVAREVERIQAGMIVVTDSEGEIRGLVAPNYVRIQVGKHVQPVSSFREALEALITNPSEGARNYRHEWLNEERPTLYWCEGGHLTDQCPCQVAAHSGSKCGPS